jgi:hypothetical protein
VLQEGFAQGAQSPVDRQHDPERRALRAAHLAERQCAHASIALDIARVGILGAHLMDQFQQQRLHLDDATSAPGSVHRRSRHGGPCDTARLVDIDGMQVGILQDRGRVLHVGRDPDRTPGRQHVRRLGSHDAGDAGARENHLGPVMLVRKHLRVSAQEPRLDAHGPLPRRRERVRIERRNALVG